MSRLAGVSGRLVGAVSIALTAVALQTGPAWACPTCKGLAQDAGTGIGSAMSLSIGFMLTALFGLLLGGGALLARSVDPAGFDRTVVNLVGRVRHRLGGGESRSTLAGSSERWITIAMAAAAITVATVLAVGVSALPDSGPPERLPIEALLAPDNEPAVGSVTAQDLESRVVVVTFFATWCAECRAQLEDLQLLASELPAELTVIGINHLEANQDRPAEVHIHADGSSHYHAAPPATVALADWAADVGIDVPLMVADRDLIRAFGAVDRLPTTMVFNPSGSRAQVYVNEPVGPFVRPSRAALRSAVLRTAGG